MPEAQPFTTSEIHAANLEQLEFFKSVPEQADPGMEQLRVNALAVATEQAGYSARALANMGPDAKPVKNVADALSQIQTVRVRTPDLKVMAVVPVRDLLSAKPVEVQGE